MIRDLQYQLQACRNLEALMLTLGWPADAAHYRRRRFAVARQIEKIRNPQSAIRN